MMEPDVFSIARAWAESRGHPVWHADETSSTNTIAKDDRGKTAPGKLSPSQAIHGPSLYLARLQTQGRGRSDHTWATPPSGALLMSWSFTVRRLPQPFFSAAAGLALFTAANAAWPSLPLSLKAPNDLYSIDKLAGILIESVEQGENRRTVIGIGFNFLSAPAGLKTATALAEKLGRVPTASEIELFLDNLCEGLRESMTLGQGSGLTLDQRARLREALNRHPRPQAGLQGPIERIDALGQLYGASGEMVRWQDL